MKILYKKSYLILIWLLHVIACHEPSIEKYRIPKNASKAFVREEVNSSKIGWEKPESWLKSSGSKMRLASYNVPSKSGYADLSVMILSGTGGGIEANINRWRAQIGLPPQKIVDINNSAKSRTCQLGTYKMFDIINPNNTDMAFLCSVIPNGDNTIFVKLSAIPNEINEIKPDFFKFCDSFKLDYE